MGIPVFAPGPKLVDIKGLSPATGDSIWWNGAHYVSRTIQVADVPTLTSAKISDFATAADARVTAAIGSSVEAWDADLDAIAALAPSNGAFIRRTSGVWVGATLVVADIPTLTLSKISDAGSIASQNANAVAITGGTIDGTNVGPTTPGTINATTAYVGVAGGPVATELTVVTTSASDPRGIMSAQYSTDTLASRIHLRKARGTPAAPSVIVPGDILGRMRFSGYDGANFLQMASIDAVSTGTIASTRVPTYLSFNVATDAAPSVLTEVGRFTITGLNNAAIGVTTPAAGTFTALTDSGALTLSGAPGKIQPGANSTTALQIAQADGTAWVDFDTTNKRIGVGTTAPSSFIDVLSPSNLGSASLLKLKNTVSFKSIEFANNSATYAYITEQGRINLGSAGTDINSSSALNIQPSYYSYGVTALYIKIDPGHTADLIQAQNSGGGIGFRLTPAGVGTFAASDAVTAAVTNVAVFDHTGGISAAGFGTGALWKGKSSLQSRELVDLAGLYNSPTDASYTTYGLLRAYYMSAGTPTARNAIGWGATGSAALIGFLAVASAPVALQTTYTQTYSTTASTVNPASTSAFTGQDNLQVGSVYAKLTDLNTLRTDLLQAMQLINKLIDDSQAYGLAA